MKRLIVLLCLVMIGTTVVQAQPIRKGTELSFRDWLGGNNQPSFQLLDPSKITFQQSASFGATVGNGESGLQSLYMARIGYQLSNPLTMTFLLGLQNSRFMGAGVPNMSLTSPFGGIMLDYHPTDDIRFHLSILRAPQQTWQSMYNPIGE
jgi:hypothetical protein